MKRISLIAALLGVIGLAFAGVAMAGSTPGPTTCPNAAKGTTSFPEGYVVPTNLTVPAGIDCRLGSAEVVGVTNISGNLYTFGKVHFDKNVNVLAGGSFAASNWGVTIDQNLNITDPAANSGNGFYGNYSPNIVKGGLNYTITPTAAAAYPDYQWPSLYFGGGVSVAKGVTYSVGTLLDHRPLDQGGLTTPSISIS